MDDRWWLCYTDPAPMLESLRGEASDRKLRLFAVACCRRIWSRICAERVRRAIEVVEAVAEGLAGRDQLRRAAATIFRGDYEAVKVVVNEDPFHAARRTSECAAFYCGLYADWGGAPHDVGSHAEQVAQCALLRDLFGNPFRPVAFDPAWLAWRDGLVVRLAQAAYEERHLPAGTLDLARLAVLADALEEAGCQDGHILGHLRSDGDHVRGCWAVDLVLGKS